MSFLNRKDNGQIMKRFLDQAGCSYSNSEDKSSEVSKDEQPKTNRKEIWIKQFDSDYIKYGFPIKSGTETQTILQCVICFEYLT